MSRIARTVAAGHPHHITQRGNYKQAVFTNPAEYSLYLKWLNEDAKKYMDVGDCRKYLSQGEDASVTTKLRTNTSSGKPLGSAAFITKLENFLGRRISPLPRGRPKKKQK